jgi:hypothetical protein
MLFDGVLAAPDEARKLKLVLEQNCTFSKKTLAPIYFRFMRKMLQKLQK